MNCECGAVVEVYCDCFKNLCRKCFSTHDCGRKLFAQFARLQEPEPIEPQSPTRLVEAMREAAARSQYARPDSMPLRDYQERCFEAVFEAFETSDSTLVVKPTGCGKTVTFGHIASQWVDDDRGRVLIVAHREELIRQAADKVGRIIGEPCDVEMGERYADQRSVHDRSPVVVTSVQTMSRQGRQGRFDPSEFSLVIVDEAHHATAATYRRVLDYFRSAGHTKILGVTATPDRADEEALGQIFESVAFTYELPDAINDGWLVPIEQQFVQVEGLDFSQCRTTAGDLNQGDLEKILSLEKVLHGIVDPTIDLAADCPTLFFAPSVFNAERIAEIVNRHYDRVEAKFLCGETPAEERRDTLSQFTCGGFQYLANCALFLEGFDEPRIACVSMARPTKSRALYAQAVGRGTRPLPGVVDGLEDADERRQAILESHKPSVLILDFVGNSGRHKLVTTADILGGNVSDAVAELALEEAKAKSRHGERVDMLAEIRAAQERIAEAAKRKRQAIIGKAQYRAQAVNPFDVFDVTPSREPGWFKGKQPTERMKSYLEGRGVDASRLSFWQAKQMIGELIGRQDKGLCTYKQAKILQRNGHDPAGITFEQAKQLIDQIAKTWRRSART